MTIAQCIHDITTTYGLVLSLFLAGLVGGFNVAQACAVRWFWRKRKQQIPTEK
ncbi:MAG: hypothetical protein R3D66_03830 [Alphaproteobacteria bacterium]